MIGKNVKEALLCALALMLVSWASVRGGVMLGARHIAPGPGYPKPGEVEADLFRFDAVYYKSIAETGYAYNGDPWSSPNLVFAPMFPLLVKTLSMATGANEIAAGFALNKILLLLSLALLYLVLMQWLPRRRVLFVLFAMVTAAGSYALHAYYSETTMLFFLSLALFAFQREWWIATGLSVAALGASRLAAFPMALGFSFLLANRAWFTGSVRERMSFVCYALLCLAGTAAYLGYIAVKFGNPFVLFNEIQKSSWGRFHQDIDWTLLLTGGYLFDYWLQALKKGVATFGDIQTLNLAWMTLGLLSALYLAFGWRRHVLTYVFVPYVLFIYYSNAGSPFLISTHRFFTPLPSLFLMLSAFPSMSAKRVAIWIPVTIAAFLLLLNIGFGWLHTAAFNQGVWYWF